MDDEEAINGPVILEYANDLPAFLKTKTYS